MTDKQDTNKQEAEELGKLREKIDSVDKQIHQLVNERASYAMQVADVKKRYSDMTPPKYYRPEREAQVLKNVMEKNQGPLDNETVARLFREIMSACLALEEPMKIAFLGPAGTFTQAAAVKHFGHAIESVPLTSIDDVFREVVAGSAHYGVVPVENSTEGMVNHTLDSFLNYQTYICGEVELRIHQHLMAGPATKPDSITRVYSHQQSLAQCRRWLDANMPKAERIAVSSNSEAAKRLNDEWNAAAIAGEMAAEIYGLNIIERNVEDMPDNTTRFLIIGREPVPPSGSDKTSCLVSTRNKPGALFKLLEPFHGEGISLTRIETRPSKASNWSYVFFIDFEGHEEDPTVRKVFKALTDEALEIQKLGSYPKAVL